jgi:uncharacterized protein YndB with AHSA1/START domain
MPVDKDFKRLVRGRMRKTGESYTAARAILLQKPAPSTAAPPRRAQGPSPDYARLAGMSDDAIKAKTGCTWARWVAALDYAKADSWSHREIAQYVHDKFKVPDWWTQTVTVGYERIKGLREIGQRRNGSFEATRSKTIPVAVGRLYRAFSDERIRRKWLPDAKLTVRKATPEKYVRITWEDGTSVEVVLTPKGDAKAVAAVSHVKLASRDDVAARKQYWGERLDALAALLAPKA